MRVPRISSSSWVALAICASASSMSAAVVDDADIEIEVEFDSGFDDADDADQDFEFDNLSASQPIVFSATQSSGTATSQAGLNAAILYDGDVVQLTFNPGLLLSQTMPDDSNPATMEINLDDFDLEAEEEDLFGGLIQNTFTLSGDIAEGGYARLRVELELDVEGPDIEVDDQQVLFDQTFESDFQLTSVELFGADGLLGIDLSSTEFEELELSGTIWLEALGGETATQLSIVTTADAENASGNGNESAPEPATLLLALLGAGSSLSYRRTRRSR